MEDKAVKKRTNKYVILGILFLSWVIGNFDKVAINVAAIPITKEFDLTPQYMGMIMSAFFLSYSVMTLLGGILADKYGHRKVLTTIMGLWSGFTALTGAAWNFYSMVAIRFIFGAAEGGFGPASSVTVAEVFPKEQRGRAKSFLVSASVIGSGLGALVTTALMVAYSWRMAFFVFGILGLILTVLFYVFIRVHKGSAEEADQAAAAAATKFSLKNVAKVPMVLQLGLIYFGAGVVNWGLTSWMPSYWVNVRGLSMLKMGAVMALPAIAMFVFMQVSGFILDKYAAGREKWVLLAGALGVALFIYLMMGASTINEAIIYSVLAFTCMAFISSTVFVLPLKYLPMGMIGSATGFINFMQQVAGIIAPTVMGFLLTRFAGSYVPVFYFVIGSVLFSAVIALLIKTKAGVQNA